MALKLIILSLILVFVAILALSVRMLLMKDGKISGGSCSARPGLRDKGFSCGCSGHCQG